MRGRPITESVMWVGAVDWDRKLFDELIPLPDGTSYNAYLVRGSEKTVLLDSVDPAFTHTLFERLQSEGINRIDYLVCHHAEQDHSGSIPQVLDRYPEVQVLATEKCKPMLVDHLRIPAGKITAVQDGERLSLGDLTLEFIHFPWVHWPETMLTWLPERRLLFTCDLFGSHLATSELLNSGDPATVSSAKRYFAEIMMPFRSPIEKSLEKVTSRTPAYIAPSHGPVYTNTKPIVDAYQEWSSATPKNLVVIPYVSMHGSTRRMVEHLVEACASRGVRTEQLNLAEPDIGKLAVMLVDACTLVLGSPTVLTGLHPKAAYAAYLANLLRPKTRFLSMIGSYGWGGKAVDQLKAMVANIKAEIIPPVLCKGYPKAEDLNALDQLADAIAEKHKGLK
jgi:flavorubredoxin